MTRSWATHRRSNEGSTEWLEKIICGFTAVSLWEMDDACMSCVRLQTLSSQCRVPLHPPRCKAGHCQRSIREDWDPRCIRVSQCVYVHMLIGHGAIGEDWDPIAPRATQPTQPAVVYNQSNTVHPSLLTHTHTQRGIYTNHNLTIDVIKQ